VKQRL